MGENAVIDLREIGVNTKNYIDLAQVRDYRRTFVNVILKLWAL